MMLVVVDLRQVIVPEVRSQNAAQVALAENDDMVQALAADRTERRARRKDSARGCAGP